MHGRADRAAPADQVFTAVRRAGGEVPALVDVAVVTYAVAGGRAASFAGHYQQRNRGGRRPQLT